MILLALLLAQAAGMDKVRVCDRANGAQCASVNSAGQVSIGGTINASSSCRATAAAPGYVEGSDDPLSCDLAGNLRTASGGVAFDISDRANRLLGHVTVDNASLAVTGTFWQATQPVSGTFWQATQPVSGTFWQATQPVSGPLTDTQLRASAVPVSGTFWQATQPVSGTVAATQSGTWTVQPGNTANTTAWKVDGSAVTQPISVVSLPLPLAAASDATVAETHAVSLGSIPTRQDMIAGSDYGTTCNGGACSQIPKVDANGIIYTAATNIVRVQVMSQVNPLLQRCNAVRRTNCQP